MYVSVLKLKMKLPYSESLKDKRMVKNSVRDKIERNYKAFQQDARKRFYARASENLFQKRARKNGTGAGERQAQLR